MLLLLLFASLACGWRPSWVPPIHDTDCTFTRADSYECLRRYVDVHPKDDQITKQEVQEAITKYMPMYLRPLFWWAGSVDSVFEQCDYDKNNVLTPRDWELSNKTCMPIKESWCTVQWFCNRITAEQAEIQHYQRDTMPSRPRMVPR